MQRNVLCKCKVLPVLRTVCCRIRAAIQGLPRNTVERTVRYLKYEIIPICEFNDSLILKSTRVPILPILYCTQYSRVLYLNVLTLYCTFVYCVHAVHVSIECARDYESDCGSPVRTMTYGKSGNFGGRRRNKGSCIALPHIMTEQKYCLIINALS